VKVETYEIFSSIDVDEEVKKEELQLIRELDLQGQKDMEGFTNPYREIGKEFKFIFEKIHDIKTDISEYKTTPIPLQVLQIIHHARGLNIFKSFKVWHSHRTQPILVAYTDDYGAQYILARWGETLDSIDDLKSMSANIARNKAMAKGKKIKAEIEAYMKSIEQMTDKELFYSDLNLDPSLYC